MSENVVLKGEVRDSLGTGAARSLRRNGLVPATIYGGNNKPLSIAIEEKEITKLYRKHGFTSTPIEIELSGKKQKVLPKMVDLHPITDLVRHADFVFLEKKGIQKVAVPIVFEGKDRALGVKRGGFFNIIHRRIEINCPVNNIPLHIEIDVTNMKVGTSLRAYKVDLPEGCSLVSKKDFVIASITGRGGGKSDEAEETAE